MKLLQFMGIDTKDVTGFTLTIGVDEAPTITVRKFIHRTVFGMPNQREPVEQQQPLASLIDPDKVENFERFMMGKTLDGRKGG